MKRTLFIVTVLINEDGNTSVTAKAHTDIEEARAHMHEAFRDTRQGGHVNDPVVLPGIFHDRPEDELCDGRLADFIQENSITVWDEHHNYFEAKITEQAVEFPDKTR